MFCRFAVFLKEQKCIFMFSSLQNFDKIGVIFEEEKFAKF